jgi:hypothetical protein
MRLTVIVSCLILVACGKDSDKAKIAEMVKEKPQYQCVFSKKDTASGGIFGSGITTFIYTCEDDKTGAECMASINSKNDPVLTTCDQFDWSVLEGL